MSIISQIVDVNCKNKLDENLAITDLHLSVDTKGYNAASFSLAAIDTLVRRGEEEAMRHWDEIVALKQRIGIDDTFRPEILHPLRPKVMTEKHRITSISFENMTPQDEKFLRQKFHLNRIDSIDAKLQQALTTSMRMDLFYQTAECQLVPEKLPEISKRKIPGIWYKVDSLWNNADGVRVILSAGNRKSVEFHAGFRFDSEEYAAVQLGLDIPLKTAIPMNTEITLRLGKRMRARGELTAHPRSFATGTSVTTRRRPN